MGFIIFGIIFFILAFMYRHEAKRMYSSIYVARMGKLASYARGGKKKLFYVIWGLPHFKMNRVEALRHYWDYHMHKDPVMETFKFMYLIRITAISLLSIFIGVLDIWILL